jgi:hypothetical protein
MNKNDIDNEAEREGLALHRQGKRFVPRFVDHRMRQQTDYNTAEFDKLFRVESMPFEESK